MNEEESRPARSPFRDGRRVVFSHIQKTGGTSLRTMLAAGLPQDRVYPADALRAEREADPKRLPEAAYYRAVPQSGRMAFWFVADHLPPCLFDDELPRPIMFTFLRNPVDRALSHLRHALVLPGLRDKTLAELFENRAIRARAVENYQTRFLAAQTLEEASSVVSERAVGPAALPLALERLAAFDAVGLSDDFSGSTELICRAISVAPPRVQKLNASDSSLKHQAEDPRLRARVADAVGYDNEVYDAARRRYALQKARRGPLAWLVDRLGIN